MKTLRTRTKTKSSRATGKQGLVEPGQRARPNKVGGKTGPDKETVGKRVFGPLERWLQSEKGHDQGSGKLVGAFGVGKRGPGPGRTGTKRIRKVKDRKE